VGIDALYLAHPVVMDGGDGSKNGLLGGGRGSPGAKAKLTVNTTRGGALAARGLSARLATARAAAANTVPLADGGKGGEGGEGGGARPRAPRANGRRSVVEVRPGTDAWERFDPAEFAAKVEQLWRHSYGDIEAAKLASMEVDEEEHPGTHEALAGSAEEAAAAALADDWELEAAVDASAKLSAEDLRRTHGARNEAATHPCRRRSAALLRRHQHRAPRQRLAHARAGARAARR
jgi:hypothetical protein